MPLPSGFFPKLFNIGWGVSVSEYKFMSDGGKVDFRHELTDTIGSWICLLIKGVETPKILSLQSIAGGH